LITYIAGGVIIGGLALLSVSSTDLTSEGQKAFYRAGALVLLLSLAGFVGWGIQYVLDDMERNERIRDMLSDQATEMPMPAPLPPN
jgi:hypothetical protein